MTMIASNPWFVLSHMRPCGVNGSVFVASAPVPVGERVHTSASFFQGSYRLAVCFAALRTMTQCSLSTVICKSTFRVTFQNLVFESCQLSSSFTEGGLPRTLINLLHIFRPKHALRCSLVYSNGICSFSLANHAKYHSFGSQRQHLQNLARK